MKRDRPDVVLLDLGLPGLSGINFIEELRANDNLALIVISRDDEPQVRIHALDIGCDDFLVKPVHVGELAARIRSVLRRRNFASGRRRKVGPWVIDFEARTARTDEIDAVLTRGEFEILTHLIEADGKIVSRVELIGAVSRNPNESDIRTVDALVSRLRRKLAKGFDQPDLIATAAGFGYRLAVNAEPA